MNLRSNIFVILFILFSVNFYGQEKEYNGNPDTSFLNARDLAFNGKREQARDTLRKILSKYPNYTDVKNLMGKTLTWDKLYNEARAIFNQILIKVKENEEVWVAAINNEFYSENYHTALGLCNKALISLKDNHSLIILRDKAISNINHLKEETESDQEEKELEETISLSLGSDFFDVVYDPMYYSSLSYSKDTKYGSIIPTLNYSNRFGINALQYQLDAYPNFGGKFYYYLSYAFSNASTYPDHRFGGEAHMSLPKSLEASLGVRYLQFDENKTTLLTGSVTWYTGNYYLSYRPYVNPGASGGSSFSNTFAVRRYFKDKDNYLSFDFGFGFSPELTQLTEENVLLSETLLYLESQSVSFGYNFTSKKYKSPIGITLGFNRQELVFDPGNFYFSVTGRINYAIKL